MANRYFSEVNPEYEGKEKKMKKRGVGNDDGRLGGSADGMGPKMKGKAGKIVVDPNEGAPRLPHVKGAE